ncbi:unnamed protein product [Ceratitis capitata]|uniref:(Mediterranean fruit fly) hypothetical protein n=1 Tax=Ceratitis capitata TaxID=7213 RepID=A0A811U169_CERCA|nr:unnamed protein product [Ceratitis capitata]
MGRSSSKPPQQLKRLVNGFHVPQPQMIIADTMQNLATFVFNQANGAPIDRGKLLVEFEI